MGYRRHTRGPGSWIAKVAIEGRRAEEQIGFADDDGAPDGSLSFASATAAALDWSKRQIAIIEASALLPASTKAPTVRTAVEAHIEALCRRNPGTGNIARGRMTRYVLSDAELCEKQLSKLRASHLEGWKVRLPERLELRRDGLAPTTVNRVTADLRAALNAMAERKQRELPAHLAMEMKVGTRAIPTDVIARKQLLTDNQVRSLIDAAFAIDEDGDFGRLVLLAAVTGARFSQLRRITVGDLQPEALRVMVPGAMKGRALRAKPRVAVPIGRDVIERLSPALASRDANQPLLECWA